MRAFSKHWTSAHVIAFVALFVALGGGALAATGFVGSGGTIKVCVTKKGAVKVVKVGKKCPKGSVALTLDQTGPAGPKGTAGGTGNPGAPGTPGAPGAPGAAGSAVEYGTVNADDTVQAGSKNIPAPSEGNTNPGPPVTGTGIPGVYCFSSLPAENSIVVTVQNAQAVGTVNFNDGNCDPRDDFAVRITSLGGTLEQEAFSIEGN